MSLGNDMPDDPGAPANTDPEGASPNEAEAAVDEARLAQETPDGDAPEGAVDGENVAEELDDIDAEVDGLQDDPDVAVESAEDDAARDLQDEGQTPVDDGAGAAAGDCAEIAALWTSAWWVLKRQPHAAAGLWGVAALLLVDAIADVTTSFPNIGSAVVTIPVELFVSGWAAWCAYAWGKSV